MQDHEPCGAEIIQLERALAKLALAASRILQQHGAPEIVALQDAIETANGFLS